MPFFGKNRLRALCYHFFQRGKNLTIQAKDSLKSKNFSSHCQQHPSLKLCKKWRGIATWPNSLSLWLTTFLIYLSQTVLFCIKCKKRIFQDRFFDKYEVDNWRTKIFDKISHPGHWGSQDCKAKASENSNFVISKRYYCLILVCIRFI